MPPVHCLERACACTQALETLEPTLEKRWAQRGGFRRGADGPAPSPPPAPGQAFSARCRRGLGSLCCQQQACRGNRAAASLAPSPLTSSSWWPSRRPAFSAREPGLTEWTKLPLALPPSKLSWEMRLSPLSVVCCTESPGPRTCPTDVTDGRKGLGQERRRGGGVGGPAGEGSCGQNPQLGHSAGAQVAGTDTLGETGERLPPGWHRPEAGAPGTLPL